MKIYEKSRYHWLEGHSKWLWFLYALVFNLHRSVCSRFLLANTITTKDPYSGWPVKIKVLCLAFKLIFTRALDRWYTWCSLKRAYFSAWFLALLYLLSKVPRDNLLHNICMKKIACKQETGIFISLLFYLKLYILWKLPQ